MGIISLLIDKNQLLTWTISAHYGIHSLESMTELIDLQYEVVSKQDWSFFVHKNI